MIVSTKIWFVNTPQFLPCGGLDITFFAGGSQPRLNAENDDVIMLIHKTSRGAIGNGVARTVSEAKPCNEKDHLSHVRARQVKDKLMDVVEHAAALSDAGHDRVEHVIRKDN